MRTIDEIRAEIEALERLASTTSDKAALASIAGQINALEWATKYTI